MSATIPASTGSCLNCGAELAGSFCSQCGQRAVTPYPTAREMLVDMWHELAGFDRRFIRTFMLLLPRPGALTIEFLEGRRARYIQPVRLYLAASLVYFLVAASVPNLHQARAANLPHSTVDILEEGSVERLPAEKRAELMKVLDSAPWGFRKPLQSIVADPAGFRHRMRETMPRVFFLLVPVFAGILALFYRRRPISQHLLLALHLQTASFVFLAVSRLAHLTRSLAVAGGAEAVILLWLAVYAVVAFRRTYRESWTKVIVKSIGIAAVYVIVTVVALLLAFVWSALVPPLLPG